ncbi:MAG: DUF805 domain-containing protein [Bradyrhizobium sp.]|nr:MAG: DUF805 domain-containing protein [Bradyrhizobium sp.]
MMTFLFSAQGRINRAKFWSSILYYFVASLIIGAIYFILWQIVPGTIGDDGSMHVEGVAAIPYLILTLVFSVALIWSGVCIGIKRFHDRDKSGWWILIQFLPIIGAFWYFIEAGCLRGTAGPNRFGADPLAGRA